VHAVSLYCVEVADGFDAVVDQLWGACYHRLLLPSETLDFDFTDALVSNLMRGIRCETPDEK
jgi:hypothetical protein